MSQRQNEYKEVDKSEWSAEEPRKESEKAAIEKAKQDAEEAKRRAKPEAEEARKTKTVGNVSRKTKKSNSGVEFITTDNTDFVSGPVTLVMDSGAQGSQISRLIYALSRNSEISVLSSGGVAGKGSWVNLSIREPMSLYQALYQIPLVKLVAKKGAEVHVTLGETG